jgi:hypothetical protein
MKSYAIASAFFIAAAAAQPRNHGHQHHHNKREPVIEIEWVTEIETVTAIVGADTTYLITPSHTPAPNSDDAQFIESTEAAAPPPAPTSTSSSAAPPPPPPPSPEPEPEPSPEPQPSPEPTPSPEPSSEPSPEPEPSSSPAPGGGGGSGEVYEGEITYYAVGLGACGEDDSGADQTKNIVAISSSIMTGSNGDPSCGRTITIESNGKSVTATVRDKCPSCERGSIDVSEKVYLELWGSLDTGRMPVKWQFN